jgi:hypothetical protein
MKEKGEKMRRLTFQAICFIALVLAAGAGAAGVGLSSSGRDSASSIPNGTYRTSFTNDQLRGPGVGPQQRRDNVGSYTLTLAAGKWSLTQKSPAGGTRYTGTYAPVGTLARVVFTHRTPPDVNGIAFPLNWSFDGKALHFKAAPGSGFPAPVVKVIWTRHPWMKRG